MTTTLATTVLDLDGPGYENLSRRMHEEQYRLVSVWASEDHRNIRVFSAYMNGVNLVIGRFSVPGTEQTFPSIASLFPAASRMERTIRDLWGWRPANAHDLRPWLDHGLWKHPPLSGESPPASNSPDTPPSADYAFIPVEGVGVHEIPVGPVHAGLIEPGHFRFQVVGEKVLRLEERLGYTHKGIERLWQGSSLEKAIKLAGRISGDTTVGHALAFSRAVESARGHRVPLRGQYLRALLLERERIANHLGDLGALANDAGLGFGLSQFIILKEGFLRQNRTIFGHRLLMDQILPGGVVTNPDPESVATMISEGEALLEQIRVLETIINEHGGLQDRFFGTGILTPEAAQEWGLCGFVGRASGQKTDLRTSCPEPPFDTIAVNRGVDTGGDVRARVAIRFFEVIESLRLQRLILESLPEGAISETTGTTGGEGEGVGLVEGWRGEILCWVHLGEGEKILAAHAHDPSTILWPALEWAVPGNLVADFPLINKSFNLSYSGQDG